MWYLIEHWVKGTIDLLWCHSDSHTKCIEVLSELFSKGVFRVVGKFKDGP